MSQPASRNGSIANWDWMVVDDFDRRVLPQVVEAFDAESPVLDAATAALMQAVSTIQHPDLWLSRTNPLIVDFRSLRVGVFNWTTDRDEFIRALLGEPVPSSPRYASVGPAIQVEYDGDLQDAQEVLGFRVGDASEIFGMDRDDAIGAASEVLPILLRMIGPEEVTRVASEAVLSADPEAFGDSPVGRMLLPVARGAPRWRRPRVATEWAGVLDVGIVGRLGFALWAPRPYEMRKHRRAMAAHLRFLFDHHVSPWNRWSEVNRRREALVVHWLRRLARDSGESVPTVPDLAAMLRNSRPTVYDGEELRVTVRRLYRLKEATGAL